MRLSQFWGTVIGSVISWFRARLQSNLMNGFGFVERDDPKLNKFKA